MSIKKLVKSINIDCLIFYLLLAVFIFAMCSSYRYFDYDLWARLVVGKSFWQAGSICGVDFMSFASNNIWYDHEWGSGVLFYAVYKIFGHQGFILLEAVLMFLAFYNITNILKLRGIKKFSIVFFILSAIAFYQTNFAPVRCQMVSFYFFSLYLLIFEKARNGNRNILFTTPFLMLIWNNMHGGCVAGLGLFVLYISGELLCKKEIKYFILPFLLNLAVLPLNPWGIDYVKFLIFAVTMPRPWIMEFDSLFSLVNRHTYIYLYFYLFFTCIFELLFSAKKILSGLREFDYTKYIVSAVVIYLGITHTKHIPFAVISICVFFYEDILALTKKILATEVIEKISKYAAMLIYASILTSIIYMLGNFSFPPVISNYPIYPVEFMRQNKLKGNVLCEFNYGSYLEYKLYPQNKIFMDGRYEETFEPKLLTELMCFLNDYEDANVLFLKYPIDIILIQKFYPVYSILLESNEWKSIYEDNRFGLLVRADKVRENYIYPTLDIDYYQKTFFDTNIKFMVQSENGK